MPRKQNDAVKRKVYIWPNSVSSKIKLYSISEATNQNLTVLTNQFLIEAQTTESWNKGDN